MKLQESVIDFEKSLGPWLGKTMKMLDYHLQEALQEEGLDLTKEQMIVLKKLHEQDGINQNELASLTYRDKSSLARLLSKMETKNYISRRQSKEDKRSNQVFLTDLGRTIFSRTRPIIKDLMNTMEENISNEEKTLVIKVLRKVQHNFAAKTVAL